MDHARQLVSVALQNAASDQGIFEVGWTHVRRSLMAHLMGNHLWWFLRPLRASRVSDNGAYTVPYIVKLIPTVTYLSIIEYCKLKPVVDDTLTPPAC